MRDLTPEEIEKDELVLAAILTAAETCGREVRPHNARNGVEGSLNYFGLKDGPCCAVGAGILYAGLKIDSDVFGVFASAHGVSPDYARGVSTAFEWSEAPTEGYASDDYYRGIAVGEAAFRALYPEAD